MAELVDALFLDDGRKQDFGIGSNPVLTTKIKIMKNEDKKMWIDIVGVYLTSAVVGYLITRFIL